MPANAADRALRVMTMPPKPGYVKRTPWTRASDDMLRMLIVTNGVDEYVGWKARQELRRRGLE